MPVIILILIILSAATILFSIGIGPVSVSPDKVLKILISRIPGLEDIPRTWEQLDQNIVIGLRLPRVLLGMVVGASLAVTGVVMQALVHNNLADPFILGVSSGASATATLGMIFGTFSFLGKYSLPVSAFIGSALTIVFVYSSLYWN
jgi:iron complex transport system permease protein